MDTIRNYVEAMFKDFPKTKEVVDMKMEILDSMEDKYNELIKDGKSEHEAIGMVISQFGNVDELKIELGLHEQKEVVSEDNNAMYCDEDKLKDYEMHVKSYANMIALGVMLCILACLGPIGDPTRDIVFGITIFFLMIASGVALFIMANMKKMKYREFEGRSIHMEPNVKDIYRRKNDSFMNTFSVGITLGVILCILSPLTYFIFEHLFEYPFDYLYDLIPAIPFFTMIAIAVFIFIRLGYIKQMYNYILDNEKICRQMQTERKAEARSERAYAVIMPFAAMLYLFIGFVFGLWHPGWLIFPFAALGTNVYLHLTERDD